MLHGEEAGGAWINWPSIDPVAMTTPNSIGSDEWESLAVRTLMIRPVHGRQDLEHKRHILADGWAVFSRKHRLLSALQLCATMKNRWDTEPISRLTGNSGHAKQNFKHFIRRKKKTVARPFVSRFNKLFITGGSGSWLRTWPVSDFDVKRKVDHRNQHTRPCRRTKFVPTFKLSLNWNSISFDKLTLF